MVSWPWRGVPCRLTFRASRLSSANDDGRLGSTASMTRRSSRVRRIGGCHEAMGVVLGLRVAVGAGGVDGPGQEGQREREGTAQEGRGGDARRQLREGGRGQGSRGRPGRRRRPAQEGRGGEPRRPAPALGRLHEKRYELDVAIDAYKAAGEKLSGPARRARPSAGWRSCRTCAGWPPKPPPPPRPRSPPTRPGSGRPSPSLAPARAQGKGDEAVDLAKKAEAAGGGAAAQRRPGRGAGGPRRSRRPPRPPTAPRSPPRTARSAPTLGLARVLRKTNRAAEAEPLLQKVIAARPARSTPTRNRPG